MSALRAAYLAAIATTQAELPPAVPAAAPDPAAPATVPPVAPAPAATPAAAASAAPGSLDAALAFIPTEALTIYIAGLAVVTQQKLEPLHGALWTVLIFAALANFLIGLQSFTVGLRAVNTSLAPSAAFGLGLASARFWAQLIVTEIAFALYVLVLPDSPILALWHIKPGWPLLLVALVIPIMGIIVKWSGLIPVSAPAAPVPPTPPAPTPPAPAAPAAPTAPAVTPKVAKKK